MAPVPEKEDSVFDFLYVDSRRIALFLSQFGQYGHLTALTKSVSTVATMDGKIDVKIASVGGHETEQSSLSKQYDAQWVGPLKFLDEANRRGMIKRLDDAHIGNLVLASGDLEIRDLAIIRKIFAMPSMRTSMLSQQSVSKASGKSRNERRQERRSGHNPEPQNTASPNPAEFGLELLAELPHALHAAIASGASRIWCSLREDSLLVAPSDIFLKHGIQVSGVWNILGILDALPSEDQAVTEDNAQAEFQQAQSAIPQGELAGIITLVTQGFGGFIDAIAPVARILLGRPTRSHGVTPLLIFREVSG